MQQHPIGFVIAMALLVLFYSALAAALMRSAGKAVAGFRPRFRGSFSSCLGGFLVAHVISLLFSRVLSRDSAGQFAVYALVVCACSLLVFTIFHTLIVKNRGEQRPTFSQAVRLGLLQVVVFIAALIIGWYSSRWAAPPPAPKVAEKPLY